ncbi:hypothetical protein GCM10010168_92970 [Actinoplanes ianthinogenes]|uniref:Uncharacterized protein n=1 Tax=Actinoplanes ianthinogenes TaxID=122358 RepID=A0ABM7LSB5_9ACTN|nr:hypothetical protein Aiant_28360 [Actinoplanes ianthinogenes]GGR59472.1 hypothetical protein GCM10010168_92970 [Actinoplanes ianthinogenes]
MSRNWSAAASAGPTEDQLRPPSTVRRTVPALPATQATDALTGASPRNRAVEPVSLSCQACGVPGAATAGAGTAIAATATKAIDNLRLIVMPGELTRPRSVGHDTDPRDATRRKSGLTTM